MIMMMMMLGVLIADQVLDPLLDILEHRVFSFWVICFEGAVMRYRRRVFLEMLVRDHLVAPANYEAEIINSLTSRRPLHF